MNQKVKIQHLSMGVILEETFANPVQFKLFLKLINGCIETKNDLTFFNGNDFFTHIPHKILTDCVISTNIVSLTVGEETLTSKIESVLK